MSNLDPGSAHVCQENSGFLFKHACRHHAEATCPKCQRQICDRHLRFVYNQFLCVSCARRPQGTAVDGRGPDGAGDYRYDPYGYADYHYPGYGRYSDGYWGSWWFASHHGHRSRHDPDDFTVADAQNLHQDGDEAFERDMGAS